MCWKRHEIMSGYEKGTITFGKYSPVKFIRQINYCGHGQTEKLPWQVDIVDFKMEQL